MPPRPGTTEPIDYEQFTERARHVLTLAQEEAQRFRHNYIGTEHLLLGLTREGEGIAGRVLSSLGVQLPKVRSAIEFIIGRGQAMVPGPGGLTPRGKTVVALAVDEARRLSHNAVGDEHLLLGMIREGEGIAAGVLDSLGVRLDRVRALVLHEVESNEEDPGGRSARPVATSQGRSPEEIARMLVERGELRQVIPIVQRQAHGGATVLGIAIERYENLSVAHWQVTLAQEERPLQLQLDYNAERPLQLHLDYTIADDRGNRYHALTEASTGESSPGGPLEARFACRVQPALDPAAGELTFALTLRLDRESLDPVPGNWQFVVPIPPLPGR